LAISLRVSAAAEVFEAIRLLNVRVPELTTIESTPVALNVTVDVLALNVPPFIVQVPLTTCENVLALNVVPVPRFTLPVITNATAAVVVVVPDIVKLPLIVVVAAARVTVPLPDKVR